MYIVPCHVILEGSSIGPLVADCINVPEALVSLELAADAVSPVQGEVVRARAAVEIDDSNSGSAKLTRNKS